MKAVTAVLWIFVLGFVLVEAGCDQASSPATPTPNPANASDASIYAHYAPVKLDIMPLTELVSPRDPQEDAAVNVYVSLLDVFGSQVKSPGVFRFELYEYVQRSAEPKGKRAVIWPDIDLTNAAKNNEHWRDFLRAYQFNLPSELQKKQDYILQVTCMCPNGRRLSAELTLRQPK
jgi:hypothetical protein